MSSPQRTYVLLLAGACIWCALIIFPAVRSLHLPLPDSLALSVDDAFSTVCHQLDSRSFHVFGNRLAVCSRCASIYAGFLIGIVLWRFGVRRSSIDPAWWWGIALVPMILDVVSDTVGMYASGLIGRSLTGGWFGIIAGTIVTPLFIQGCAELYHLFLHLRKSAYEFTTE